MRVVRYVAALIVGVYVCFALEPAHLPALGVILLASAPIAVILHAPLIGDD